MYKKYGSRQPDKKEVIKNMGIYEFPFTMEQVVGLLDFGHYRSRGNVMDVDCPRCGHKDKLHIDLVKETYFCWHTGCEFNQQGGGMLDLYANCRGLNRSEARQEIMESLNLNDLTKSEIVNKVTAIKSEKEKYKESKIRNIKDLNNTNHGVVRNTTLAKDHIANLIGRGLGYDAIVSNHYRTMPTTNLKEHAIKLLYEGLYVDGIPGFYRKEPENKDDLCWSMVELKRGILIPYVDYKNRIQGFQIRKDDKLLKTWIDNKDGKLKKEKKCNWFSSPNRKDGCSCLGWVHFAVDFILKSNGEYEMNLSSDEILLTEGALKADIHHYLTGEDCIAIPGVMHRSELKKVLPLLKSKGIRKINIAFDMDYLKKESVQNSLKSIIELILSYGIEAEQIVWNPLYNGIDDYDYAKIVKKEI